MSRLRAVVLGIGIVGALVSCKEPARDPAPTKRRPDQETASAAFRQKAQVEALQRLAPRATEVFVLADPVAAAQAAQRSLRAPAIGARGRESLRPDLERTWRDASGIERELLSLRDKTVLQTIRFGLMRIRDRLDRRRPAVTDPGWSLSELVRLLDEVRWRSARGECDAACWNAVEELCAQLEPTTRELGAAALPWVEATLADLDALRRAERPWWDETSDDATRARTALDNALDQTHAYLERVAGHLSKASIREDLDWARIGSAADPSDVVRLSPTLPPREFRRRLEVEEGIVRSIEDLYAEVGQALGRLRGLAAPSQRPSEAGSDATRVTHARCLDAWAPIETWVNQQPALQAAQLDCGTLVRSIGSTTMTDAELTGTLVEQGVVLPTERARRAEELDVIAMVSGRATPPGHRLALGIAVLSGVGDRSARAAYVERGMTTLCESAAALWIHGALGDDPALHERLDRYCPGPAAGYLDAARARPRAALDGLGMIRIGTGPADVIALERFWWAPLGLLDDLANPANAAADPFPPLEVEVAPLDPPPSEP